MPLYNRRIRTVLYGDQRFSDVELDLLHTPSLQRLYGLHQLGLTDRVFVDASHTRFSHVLGVMHQASKLLAAIKINLEKQSGLQLRFTSRDNQKLQIETRAWFHAYIEKVEPSTRFMALLHDLTHAPFGHTLEDEICLSNEKHDQPSRQAQAFLLLICEWIVALWHDTDSSTNDTSSAAIEKELTSLTVADGERCVELMRSDGFKGAIINAGVKLCASTGGRSRSLRGLSAREIVETLRQLKFAFRALFYLDVAHKMSPNIDTIPETKYPVEDLIDAILDHELVGGAIHESENFQIHRDLFLLDIIGNTICADLLDYAKRDAITSGLRLDYDSDRIVENFTLVQCRASGLKKGHPLKGDNVRAAVSLFSHKFRPDTVGELIGLLQTRYYVYERMLYHPTKCIAGSMLGTMLQLMGWRDLPLHLKRYGDDAFLCEIRQAAVAVTQILETVANSDRPFDSDTLKQLQRRLQGVINVPLVATVRKLIEHYAPNRETVKSGVERLLWLVNEDAVSDQLEKIIETCKTQSDQDAWEASMKSQMGELKQINPFIANTILPSTQTWLQRVNSAISLLDQLTSRRYPQRIYSMIGATHTAATMDPETKVPKLKYDAVAITEKFLDPTTRFIAEREIERQGGLPLGSLVIHCPSARGPVKLAKVLITHGDHINPPEELRFIGDLEGLKGKILKSHQDMVEKLEQMYGSTWRLSVAVKKPHDKKWAALQAIIGRVIYDIVSEGLSDGTSGFANDETMVLELGAMEERSSRGYQDDFVKHDADNVENIILGVFRRHPAFGSILNAYQSAAMSKTADEAMPKAQMEKAIERLLIWPEAEDTDLPSKKKKQA